MAKQVGWTSYSQLRNLYYITKAWAIGGSSQAVLDVYSSDDDAEWNTSDISFANSLINSRQVDPEHRKWRKKCSIMVQVYHQEEVLMELNPHYLEKASHIQFSTSGRLLIVSNEQSQYFYIYKIFPTTELWSNPERLPCAQLAYSLFRGYTPAEISDIGFSMNDEWLTISTENGTTHIYYLEQEAPKDDLSLSDMTDQSPWAERDTNLSSILKIRHKDSLLSQAELSPISMMHPVDEIPGRKQSNEMEIKRKQKGPWQFMLTSLTAWGEMTYSYFELLSRKEYKEKRKS